MSNKLKERLDKGPVICAEGFLFEIERRGYMASGEFVPMVSLDHPEVLENLHREFQHAGSDVVEAFTYNGHREKMRVIGKEELLEPLNRAALKIAKKVALDTPKGSKPNLMAGNISNSNIWKENDKQSQKEVERMFSEMIGWAVDEGADVVGLNCFRGPATMFPFLKEIRKAVKCHVGALPIPYRTNDQHPTFFNLPDRDDCSCPSPHGRTFPTALDPHFCNRYEIGKFAKDAHELGINYLGVCCGANPMLIREVAESIGLKVPASKYRENMENHFMYGKNKRIPKHMTEYGDKA